MSKQDAVQKLLIDMRMLGLPDPFTEHRFDKERKWRFDLCWPVKHVAAEIDGGTWIGGRHTSGKGFEGDCRKINAATLQGWAVYRFTMGMVRDGTALSTLEEALR